MDGYANRVKFDYSASGGGTEAVCRLENGRLFLEWRFYLCGDPEKGDIIRILLTDCHGETALECVRYAGEEEPLRSILFQPHLWKGREDPSLYDLEVTLTDKNGGCLDRICRKIPLRTVDTAETDGHSRLFLNREPFCPRAVRYFLPSGRGKAEVQRQVWEDLRSLLALGADTVYIEDKKGADFFLQWCERMGILAMQGGEPSDVPLFRGGEGALISRESGRPTALFYRYRAEWSREPFVHIVPESLRRTESGNYEVRCFSSCSRIALYSDGVLHQFQTGGGEYLFQEIPAKTPCIMLTAEGEGCSGSLSVQKSCVGIRN